MKAVKDLEGQALQIANCNTSTEKEGTWLCKCGKTYSQKPGTGWSNLNAHIAIQHGTTTSNQSRITGCFLTAKATTIYSWLDWVCN